MKPQNFRCKDIEIARQFVELKKSRDLSQAPRLNFSWSNWGFGTEPLEETAKRLDKYGIRHIELHGNKYGKDLGYKAPEVRKILEAYGIQAVGICGIVSPRSEFASNIHQVRQECIDYFRRHIEFCAEAGGNYILFPPGAVGRTEKYDDNEFYRAAEAIRIVGDDFVRCGIRGALEPVRSDEVSLCHTFAEAQRLLEEINHPGIRHIAGDLFHMLLGEEHIGSTIIRYKEQMINLHLADTNRRALGTGMLDLDVVIMALYVAGFNREHCYCTPEPLGTGANPYAAMYGRHNPAELDELVRQTATCFREREMALLEAEPEDILRYYS